MNEAGLEARAACDMTGTYFHNADAKGRINFPAKLREVLGESFWIARGISDRFLAVYSHEGWADIMRQVDSKPGTQADRLRRWMCSGAVEVTPDKQGRILIPVALREYARLDKDVVVIGAGHKAEIWDYAAWKEADDAFDPLESGLLDDVRL